MRHLKDTVPVVRFEEDWSKIKKPAVATITFDDGYADNVLEALPIIEEVGVPVHLFYQHSQYRHSKGVLVA
jgi:peptidoglycan/xylan/chitin deacetylase (PgdA/CDA1 family)